MIDATPWLGINTKHTSCIKIFPMFSHPGRRLVNSATCSHDHWDIASARYSVMPGNSLAECWFQQNGRFFSGGLWTAGMKILWWIPWCKFKAPSSPAYTVQFIQYRIILFYVTTQKPWTIGSGEWQKTLSNFNYILYLLPKLIQFNSTLVVSAF